MENQSNILAGRVTELYVRCCAKEFALVYMGNRVKLDRFYVKKRNSQNFVWGKQDGLAGVEETKSKLHR